MPVTYYEEVNLERDIPFLEQRCRVLSKRAMELYQVQHAPCNDLERQRRGEMLNKVGRTVKLVASHLEETARTHDEMPKRRHACIKAVKACKTLDDTVEELRLLLHQVALPLGL